MSEHRTTTIPARASVAFVVIVSGAEPPPNWAASTYKNLSREVELMYGNNASVRPLVNYAMPVIESYTATDPDEALIVTVASTNGVRNPAARPTHDHPSNSGELR